MKKKLTSKQIDFLGVVHRNTTKEMKDLTTIQFRFLRKVMRLHVDILSTYRNPYSIFTKEIYDSGEYNKNDSSTLNHVATLYTKWKNKNKCKLH